MNSLPPISESARTSIYRAHTDKMRDQMLKGIRVEKDSPNVILSGDRGYSLRWKKGRFRRLAQDHPETLRRTWQAAVFDASEAQIAIAYVEEFSLRKLPRRVNWADSMDETSDRFRIFAEAFSEGWPFPEGSLLEFGNLAVLENVAASRLAGSPAHWAPLVDEFIKRCVFEEAFVVIGEVYPHDIEYAVHQLIETRYPDRDRDVRKFDKRWDAKLKFFSRHMGLIPFWAEDGRPHWMYRLRDPDDLEQQPQFA